MGTDIKIYIGIEGKDRIYETDSIGRHYSLFGELMGIRMPCTTDASQLDRGFLVEPEDGECLYGKTYYTFEELVDLHKALKEGSPEESERVALLCFEMVLVALRAKVDPKKTFIQFGAY